MPTAPIHSCTPYARLVERTVTVYILLYLTPCKFCKPHSCRLAENVALMTFGAQSHTGHHMVRAARQSFYHLDSLIARMRLSENLSVEYHYSVGRYHQFIILEQIIVRPALTTAICAGTSSGFIVFG